MPTPLMRDANALAATVQQLFAGLGVAAATVALRIGDLLPGEASDRAAFAVGFAMLALVAALRLHPGAGQVLVRAR